MSNYPRRQGIDWVAISIGCSVIVLLVAVLLALFLVYTIVSSQPSITSAVTPIAAVEIAGTDDQPVELPPTVLPTEPGLVIVTATPIPTATPTPTAVPPTPTPGPAADARDIRADIPPSIIQEPITELDRDNLDRMWTLDLPPYDYYEVARQFGDAIGERTVTRPLAQVGEVRDFLVDERVVSAELVSITDNVYIWMENGYVYSSAILSDAAITIENDIYTTIVDLFGTTEWKPGVDNDPHFSVLHLTSIDTFDEIGFFNSVNQYPATLDDSSNQQEIIFLNMDQLELGSDLYFATVAHEIQHLIQWNQDRNETVWLNEGLAQLAEAYLGYQTSETLDYLNDTALQLNTWGYDGDVIYRHYAASYLFVTYFWEQLGDDAIRDLSRSQLNGMASVREVLNRYQPETTLEQFMANWAAANLLDDDGSDGRYGYSIFRIAFPDKEERVRSFPWESVKLIPQYGAHYIDIRESGTYSLTFAGDTTAQMLPSQPPKGDRVWFSPASNDAAATLTRKFDLSLLNSATLEFTAWYELERDFDFAYVEVSTDEGASWRTLAPANYAPGIYGAALTGRSAALPSAVNGWITEGISLDSYVGQEVLIRFHVLNDGAFSERGFALSSIGVPEINYLSTADERPDDWVSAGFAVVGTELPQRWSVQLVQGQTVRPILLDPLNRATWTVSADSQGATLIIMPQTPWINDMATYWLKIEQSTAVNP